MTYGSPMGIVQLSHGHLLGPDSLLVTGELTFPPGRRQGGGSVPRDIEFGNLILSRNLLQKPLVIIPS